MKKARTRTRTKRVAVPRASGPSWRSLRASRFLAKHLKLRPEEHGYCEGSQHVRSTRYKTSRFASSLFVLQTTAAASGSASDGDDDDEEEKNQAKKMKKEQKPEKKNDDGRGPHVVDAACVRELREAFASRFDSELAARRDAARF